MSSSEYEMHRYWRLGKNLLQHGVIGLVMYTKYTLSKLRYILDRYGSICGAS
jgi:hypothetical protein